MQRVITTASAIRPSALQRVELEGKEFVIELAWNGRVGAWFARVADTNGVDIRRGVRIVDKAVLLAGVVDARKPTGELVITTRNGSIGIDSFADGGASLVYLTAAEVAAARPRKTVVTTSLFLEPGEPVEG